MQAIYIGNNGRIPRTVCSAVRLGTQTELWFGANLFIVPSNEVTEISAGLIAAPEYSDMELPPTELAEFCDERKADWLRKHFGESGFDEAMVMAFCLWRNWLDVATEGREPTPENVNAIKMEACRRWTEAKRLGKQMIQGE